MTSPAGFTVSDMLVPHKIPASFRGCTVVFRVTSGNELWDVLARENETHHRGRRGGLGGGEGYGRAGGCRTRATEGRRGAAGVATGVEASGGRRARRGQGPGGRKPG